MKFYLRIISGGLAFLLLISCLGLISCSQPNDVTETTETSVDSDAHEVETSGDSRLDAKDNLPANLDFNKEEIRLLTRTGDPDTLREFVAEKEDADVVSSAVYERNANVEGRLNIKLEIIPSSDGRHAGDAINDLISKTVSSGLDEYDIVANHMSQSTTAVVAGYMSDLTQYDYLDQDMPWWNSSYAEMITVADKQYLCVGELSLTYISGMYAMFYNKDLWQETHAENELYELVLSDGWTLDALLSYTQDYNRDLNGNSKQDDEDLCGLYYQQLSIMSDAIVFASNIRFMELTEDGTYDYVLSNDRTYELVDKMKVLLFENNATYLDPNGLAFGHSLRKLSQNTALFTINMLGGTTYLRDMEGDYGILPLPKLNKEQKAYTGLAHTGCSVFGIPQTAEKGDVLTAFLEAICSESYRRVTPAYFDTALKLQYARDPLTSQMLDIISQSMIFDFVAVYNQPMDSKVGIFRGLFSDESSIEKAASTIKGLEREMERRAQQLVSKIEDLD